MKKQKKSKTKTLNGNPWNRLSYSLKTFPLTLGQLPPIKSLNSQFPLVYIEWEDSVLGFQGWKIINEQPKEKLTVFISVGFIVYENNTHITLYPHIEKCKENHAGTGDIKIPRSAIRKIKTLKI